jgi:hypothetical protein
VRNPVNRLCIFVASRHRLVFRTEKEHVKRFPGELSNFRRFAGALVERWVERRAADFIPHFARLARLGAAADNTLDRGVEAFLAELEITSPPSRLQHWRIRRGLGRYAASHLAYRRSVEQFERAFFGPGPEMEDATLQEIDWQRRIATERILYPRRTLGFLANEDAIAPVRHRPFSPDELFSQWAEEIWNPSSLYFAPTVRQRFVASRSFRRGATREYFLRFQSPSRFLSDPIQARVFEPLNAPPEMPTVVYCGGLGMSYDLLRCWPEEEYAGAWLAARGFRAVLPESPWHGRRTPRGVASGELPLATSPFGMVLLVATQTQEVAALIHWARSLSSSAVAVGGISLGSIVAQQASAWSRDWPEAMRPDAVFLNGAGLCLDRCAMKSRLLRLLEVDHGMKRAGWTELLVGLLRPLVEPPSPPAVSPDRYVVVLGSRDDFLPYSEGTALVKRWRIPEANVLTWDVGHLGIALRLARTEEAQQKWAAILRRASRQAKGVAKITAASPQPERRASHASPEARSAGGGAPAH